MKQPQEHIERIERTKKTIKYNDKLIEENNEQLERFNKNHNK